MSKHATDIDFILDEVVGGFGRWQLGFLLLNFLIKSAALFPLLVHLFAAFVPRHRCLVPVCDQGRGRADEEIKLAPSYYHKSFKKIASDFFLVLALLIDVVYVKCMV